jgi:hypothetical protein
MTTKQEETVAVSRMTVTRTSDEVDSGDVDSDAY